MCISYVNSIIVSDDFNRIKLKPTESNENNDYINASDIHLEVGDTSPSLHYITCQGPLSSTGQHFWQMVWENDVTVIAMVTQEIESGKAKCHRYWPLSADQPIDFGNGYVIIVCVCQH